MKLPEEPTKKVREILATVLQCPGYKINEKDLYEIKKLCDRFDKLERENKILKIQLDMYDADATALIEEHGRDPDDKIDREVLKRMLNSLIGKNVKLKTKLELAMSQNYCTVCGNILDSYVPPKEKK